MRSRGDGEQGDRGWQRLRGCVWGSEGARAVTVEPGVASLWGPQALTVLCTWRAGAPSGALGKAQRLGSGVTPGTHPSSPLLRACVLAGTLPHTRTRVRMLTPTLCSALTTHVDPHTHPMRAYTLAHSPCVLHAHTHGHTLTRPQWIHGLPWWSGAPRAPADQHPGQ